MQGRGQPSSIYPYFGLVLILLSNFSTFHAEAVGSCLYDTEAALWRRDDKTCVAHSTPPPKLTDSQHPWAYTPVCVKDVQKIEKYCLYTSLEFNNGAGISFMVKPVAEFVARSLVEDPSRTRRAEQYLRRRRSPDDVDLPYKVVELPSKGRSVIAVRPIRRGELIMVEFPAIVVDQELERGPDPDISDADRYQLYKLAFARVADTERALSSAAMSGGNIYEDIFKTNAFAITVDGRPHSGHFPETALMNHACAPNAVIRFARESLGMEAMAAKDISTGDEISISYIPVELPSSQRYDLLKSIYNFECGCSLCSAPVSLKMVSDKRRVRISAIRERLRDPRTSYQGIVKLSSEILHLAQQEDLGYKFREYYQDLIKAYFKNGDIETAIRYAKAALEDEEEFGSSEGEFRRVLWSNLQALEGMLRRRSGYKI